jgi:hypothetical protein
MFLADTLRTELPRQLQKRLTIMVLPYRDGGSISVVFQGKDGHALELEIDPETGLTDAQLARILIEF